MPTAKVGVLIMVTNSILSAEIERCAESQRLRATCVKSSSTCISTMLENQILIIDDELPNGTSRLLISHWLENVGGPVCVLAEENADAAHIVDLYRMGATHVLTRPVDLATIFVILTAYVRIVQREQQIAALEKRVRQLTMGLVANSLLLVAVGGPEVVPWIIKLFGG